MHTHSPVTYVDLEGNAWPGWQCSCGTVYTTEPGARRCPCQAAPTP